MNIRELLYADLDSLNKSEKDKLWKIQWEMNHRAEEKLCESGLCKTLEEAKTRVEKMSRDEIIDLLLGDKDE